MQFLLSESESQCFNTWQSKNTKKLFMIKSIFKETYYLCQFYLCSNYFDKTSIESVVLTTDFGFSHFLILEVQDQGESKTNHFSYPELWILEVQDQEGNNTIPTGYSQLWMLEVQELGKQVSADAPLASFCKQLSFTSASNASQRDYFSHIFFSLRLFINLVFGVLT